MTWAEDHAMTVVMAAQGYPGSYGKGDVIGGLEALPEDSHHMVFHAGTAARDGAVVANGGRVLNVTARGTTLQEARDRATGWSSGDLAGGVYRRDTSRAGARL